MPKPTLPEETDGDDIITVTDKKTESRKKSKYLREWKITSTAFSTFTYTDLHDGDTTCKYRDVNPVFEKEVYIDRLKRMPTIIEMPYNEVVQKFIVGYSGKLRRSVSFYVGSK